MATASVCDTASEPPPIALPQAIGENAALPTLAAAGLTILLFGLTQ